MNKNSRFLLSGIIFCASLGLAFFKLPELSQSIVVVSGTELQEPLEELEAKFEEEYPNIDVELQFQGSQDIVNNYVDQKNSFNPTVLIPANGEVLNELEKRWAAQNQTDAFLSEPQPIAKTFLVAIAWKERADLLFPNQQFQWSAVEDAMTKKDWGAIANQEDWGSFDFVITDPTRSNSGQLALALWAESKLNTQSLDANSLNQPKNTELFRLIKKSVYQPPRSTDILLQEFISRGANEGDVAIVYESIALYRWQQAAANQSNSYQIYHLNPTIETVSTAAIASQNVTKSQAKAAQKWIDFLLAESQQKTFVTYGFRPVNDSIDLASVANSPWSQNIPGSQENPTITIQQAPSASVIGEIQRLWLRSN